MQIICQKEAFGIGYSEKLMSRSYEVTGGQKSPRILIYESQNKIT